MTHVRDREVRIKDVYTKITRVRVNDGENLVLGTLRLVVQLRVWALNVYMRLGNGGIDCNMDPGFRWLMVGTGT